MPPNQVTKLPGAAKIPLSSQKNEYCTGFPRQCGEFSTNWICSGEYMKMCASGPIDTAIGELYNSPYCNKVLNILSGRKTKNMKIIKVFMVLGWKNFLRIISIEWKQIFFTIQLFSCTIRDIIY